MNPIEAKMD